MRSSAKWFLIHSCARSQLHLGAPSSGVHTFEQSYFWTSTCHPTTGTQVMALVAVSLSPNATMIQRRHAVSISHHCAAATSIDRSPCIGMRQNNIDFNVPYRSALWYAGCLVQYAVVQKTILSTGAIQRFLMHWALCCTQCH